MERFLCDQMCGDLARWLRAAGYDTSTIETPMDDRAIFKRAVEEKRLLLTRDRFFKELDPEEKTVVYLEGDDLDGWAKQLKGRRINWLFDPFSRCLQCNSRFEKIATDKWYCPICHQLFWQGSHTENMHSQLKKWQAAL